jgi:hypothetical protein
MSSGSYSIQRSLPERPAPLSVRSTMYCVS